MVWINREKLAAKREGDEAFVLQPKSHGKMIYKMSILIDTAQCFHRLKNSAKCWQQ